MGSWPLAAFSGPHSRTDHPILITSEFRFRMGGCRHYQGHLRRYPRCLSPGGLPPSKPWLSSQACSSVVKSEPSRPSCMRPSGTFGEGSGEPAPEGPTAAAQDEGAWLKLRDDGDYRRPALQIVKSQAWKTLPANSGSKRKRAIGRLMSRALSGG